MFVVMVWIIPFGNGGMLVMVAVVVVVVGVVVMVGVVPSGNGGMLVLGCGGGCLAFRAARVSESRFASVSSEHASRTAPLKSPSSSLLATRAARVARGSELGSDLVRFLCSG